MHIEANPAEPKSRPLGVLRPRRSPPSHATASCRSTSFPGVMYLTALDVHHRIVIKTQTQESLGFEPYSLRAASTGWNWRGAFRSSRLAAHRHRRPKPYALGCISIRHHEMLRVRLVF